MKSSTALYEHQVTFQLFLIGLLLFPPTKHLSQQQQYFYQYVLSRVTDVFNLLQCWIQSSKMFSMGIYCHQTLIVKCSFILTRHNMIILIETLVYPNVTLQPKIDCWRNHTSSKNSHVTMESSINVTSSISAASLKLPSSPIPIPSESLSTTLPESLPDGSHQFFKIHEVIPTYTMIG